jgi:hypothetical protein
MPLTVDTAPETVVKTAHRAVHAARRARRGQALRLPIRLSPGIQVFSTPITRLRGRFLSATEPRGWVFLAIDADNVPCIINISIVEREPLATHRSFGRAAAELLQALTRVEKSSRGATRVRQLRIPGLFFSALWLQTGTRSRLVVLHPRDLIHGVPSLGRIGHALAALAAHRTRAVDEDHD